ncbi:MAG: c-type cytochrome [Myxococcales bacterium]|jgi:cytochrome c peroxidase|nr:c-type cytochrome [Myxococcales bacterium]
MSQRIAPLALLGLAALAACEEKKPQPAPAPTGSTTAAATASAKPKPAIEPTSTSVNPFPALPASFASAANAASDDKIALGKMLYFEARLSKNHDVSCASCHAIDKHGVDGEPTSTGHKKQKGGRNAPTVLNAAGHMAQFWDGRAATIEDQAGGPILNPIEMAMPNEKAVLDTLKSIPGYVDAFKKAFPADKDPITYDNLKKSIGAFERTLATPSRWDKFVAGDASALTDDEKAGFKAFDAAGCPSCHTGTLFGGTMYKKLGEVKPYPGLKDNGRFDVTKQEVDKFAFKVPSLRNVEKTAPYFHDGSVKTLDEAVKLMGVHQLGKELKAEEVTAIVTFLKALTADAPKVAKPDLPPSGPKTPKPDPG